MNDYKVRIDGAQDGHIDADSLQTFLRAVLSTYCGKTEEQIEEDYPEDFWDSLVMGHDGTVDLDSEDLIITINFSRIDMTYENSMLEVENTEVETMWLEFEDIFDWTRVVFELSQSAYP